MKALATLALLGLVYGSDSDLYSVSRLRLSNGPFNATKPLPNVPVIPKTINKPANLKRIIDRILAESDDELFNVEEFAKVLADHELSGPGLQKVKNTVCSIGAQAEPQPKEKSLMKQVLSSAINFLGGHKFYKRIDFDDEEDNELFNLNKLLKDAMKVYDHAVEREHNLQVSHAFAEHSDNSLWSLKDLMKKRVPTPQQVLTFEDDLADNTLWSLKDLLKKIPPPPKTRMLEDDDDIADNNLLALGELLREIGDHAKDAPVEIYQQRRPNIRGARAVINHPQQRQILYVENPEDESLFVMCIPTVKKGKLCFNKAD